MKIAIDISPLSDKSVLSHRVRGVGFYLTYLKQALVKYYPENEYVFFTRDEKIDKSVDLVHYPYFEPFFLTLPFFDKHKRVITVHDLTPLVFPDNFPVGLKGNLKWQIQKQNLLRSDRVITDSIASKNDINKYAGINENKIDVAYLAAGEEFRPLANSQKLIAKYHLPSKFVLYVGDVTWNKNLPRIIKAVTQTNIPFIMVGSSLNEENFDKENSWNHDLLETQKLISLNSRIKRLGFIPTNDLVGLYNSASALIMPSIYEGFGLPILEAMQSGCPVITSKGGSIPEVAGDAAYFVEYDDIENISNGIGEIFENTKLRKDLSEKGLKQAKKFGWEKTAKQTIKTYEKILKSK